MTDTPTAHLSHDDLMAIRDAVPGLDLLGIRSLSRAGYRIVREQGAGAQGAAAPESKAADRYDS
nr:hypothetical protein [uncultured Lichenicoccus sp.]